VLDKAKYSAFESTLNSSMVSYRIEGSLVIAAYMRNRFVPKWM